MKKLFTFFTLSLLISTVVFAGPIDQAKAHRIAASFWKQNAKINKNITLQLVQEGTPSKAASRETVNDDAQYYIFSTESKQGFIIVSGDDRLTPVIGYSENCSSEEMPPQLEAWLDEYSNYVEDVRAGVAEPVLHETKAGGKAIAPMLETSWNQSAPYNNKCPEVNGQKTPTGCTATAMAQIMKFHEWPVTPTKNVVWRNNITGTSETLYLTSRKYQWDNMLPHYRNGYTQEQAEEVATLMEDVGKAINSSYALEGTGSSEIYASYALVNIFDYSPKATIVRRAEYTEEEYVSIIRENLEARQPLMYTGMSQSYSSGHAFVCDGIDENDLLHIDWGWDGSYNGYFDMTYMSPSGTGIGGGDGRYNVAQTLIANITPRTKDEQDVDGEPVVYMMYVVDVNTDLNQATPATLFSQTSNYNTSKEADFRFAAGLLNWSHSDVDLQMCIAFEKDGEIVSLSNVGEERTLPFQESLGYYITLTVSNDASNKNYLQEGAYNVFLCYSDKSGKVYFARGADNGLLLEVGSESVTISKILPEIELTSTTFHKTPSTKGDALFLDAEFMTVNGRSATVLIVPVVNKINADGTYTSTPLNSEAEVIQVHDGRSMKATFETSYTIPADGEYYISFKYNIKNHYTDHDTSVDTKNLFDIAGKSDNFVVKSQFDKATPSTTSITAGNINWGDNLNLKATIKNISTTDDTFNGILGVFLENTATGEKHILTRTSVEGLAKNKTVDISYNQPDYFPIIKPGSYTAYICRQENGKWEKIKQSAATCNFSINSVQKSIPYAVGRMVVNGGDKHVCQGSTFDTNVKLSCTNGDFNGYIKILISNGLSKYIESEQIAVSLKEGETNEYTITSTCSTKTKLGRYRMNINYYDSNKSKLGTISLNTIDYPDNGYFWVADATAIDNVADTDITVTTSNGYINVKGAHNDTIMNVYNMSGCNIYSGQATSIAVKAGVYIVTLSNSTEETKAVKVIVK